MIIPDFSSSVKVASLDFKGPEDIFVDMKAGYVAIVGKPNVGKSTLLNRLIGEKLSIITDKPQTTRHRILGIWTENDNQILFIDTPGHFKPRNELGKAMQVQIKNAFEDADLVLLIIAPPFLTMPELILSECKKPIILLINKIDLILEEELKRIKENLVGLPFNEVFAISALKGDNVDKLTPKILEYLPDEHPLYPEDLLSNRSERFFIEEIMREKVFEEYKQEIPYATAVKVVNMKDGEIDIKIFVEKESQEGIIIGKGGRKLKEVGTRARKDIENFLGRHVYLKTRVSVRKKWRKKKEEVRRFGYYE